MTKTGGRTALAARRRIGQEHGVAIFFIFLLGIGNFALHRAVMDSNHPALGHIRLFTGRNGRRLALALEFGVLLAALMLAANGWSGLAWGYLVYTALNGFSGWMILSGRV